MKKEIPQGLSLNEVKQRVEAGKTNEFKDHTTRSYKDIITSNLFTLFNYINIVLAVLILITGQLRNLLFITIVIWNIIIGIVQEIRSKRILDKLSILNQSGYDVVRDHTLFNVTNNDIVLDDVIMLKSGQQVPCDAIVLSGAVEVNESLITGESDIIKKEVNDQLCSGSIIVSGQVYVRATAVGKDAYANRILTDIKVNNKHQSELMDALNKILKIISIIIIPIGIILFGKQFFISQVAWQDAITSTVAALIGMIPEGVILLTSITLALGTIRLARQKTLVQELYCIETLARVDTLCCDKTGTLTQGKMKVVDVVGLHTNDVNIELIINQMFKALDDDNATAQALRNFSKDNHLNVEWDVDQILNFSSTRKCCGIHVQSIGSFVLGAYNFIIDSPETTLIEAINHQTSQGRRVVVLCYLPDMISESIINQPKTILGFLALTDPLRPEAQQTLNYFYKQGVDVKIISGDDVNTVAQIANEAHVYGAERFVDASTLTSDEAIYDAVRKYNVFGRATPQQKQQMIKALQQQGHITAMTGDGVNDVLALKTADCSIAMGNGSEASKNVANLVLLDSNFTHMPQIVNEGRRVINNIRRTTSLFLVKTVFSVLLSIATIFVLRQYPFQPIQLSLISSLAIGIPAYLLALENNPQPIVKDFINSVMSQALPGGISAMLLILIFDTILDITNWQLNSATISTMCMLILGGCIFNVLYQVSKPLNTMRKTILIVFGFLFVMIMCLGPHLVFFNTFITQLNLVEVGLILILLVLIIPIQAGLRKLILRKGDNV